MSCVISVRVESDAFGLENELRALRHSAPDMGAVVTFTGHCRSEEGRLAALELEHYPGMAEHEIERIAVEAAERWPVAAVTIIHRHGLIPAGEPIVLIATASAHRRAAFEAADFLMDFLKTRAPFWKREHRADGSIGDWVAAKGEDDAALERWGAQGQTFS